MNGQQTPVTTLVRCSCGALHPAGEKCPHAWKDPLKPGR